MKKFNLHVLCFYHLFLYSNIFAQDENLEKEVIITYTWSHIQSHGSNQIAIWIEDTLQNHICTLFATRFTTNGGYVYRPISLSEWAAKFDLKNASKEEVDAITGSTPQSGKQIVTWHGKDKSGKAFSLPVLTSCGWRLISLMQIRCSSGAR